MPDDQQPGQEPNKTLETPNSESGPGTEEPFDKDRAMATISKLREFEKVSKAQAKELEQLKAKLAEHDAAKLSETERLQQRVAELESKDTEHTRERQERTLRYETQLTASKLNIVDPDAAYRLLDLSKVEYDEDGIPKNAEQLLKELVKAKPYLVAQVDKKSVPPTPKGDDEKALSEQQRKDAAARQAAFTRSHF